MIGQVKSKDMVVFQYNGLQFSIFLSAANVK